MPTKTETLQNQEARLLEKLKKVREDIKKSQEVTPESILDKASRDPRTRQAIAQLVYEETGKNPPVTAKLLRMPVSEMHKARKGE